MYKTLCVASILLATISFTSGSKPANASEGTLAVPTIVARVVLRGQTQQIPTSTLFTPKVTGVYRIEEYVTNTLPDPNNNNNWSLQINWTDEAGPESRGGVGWQASILGPGSDIGFSPGATAIIYAVAGSPVSYSTTLVGGGSGGTYSLYLTAEKL
jgi:hypothetical protein